MDSQYHFLLQENKTQTCYYQYKRNFKINVKNYYPSGLKKNSRLSGKAAGAPINSVHRQLHVRTWKKLRSRPSYERNTRAVGITVVPGLSELPMGAAPPHSPRVPPSAAARQFPSYHSDHNALTNFHSSYFEDIWGPHPRYPEQIGIVYHRLARTKSPHPGKVKRKACYKAPATNYYFNAGLNLKALHRAADKSYILEETIKVLVQELKAQVESWPQRFFF